MTLRTLITSATRRLLGCDGCYELRHLPRSTLQLNIGVLLMLLRNLGPNHGLRNGTRMALPHASTRRVEVRLNDGYFVGERQLIYRTKLTSNESDFNFQSPQLGIPVRA
jgi:PIF1-like helicase